MELNRDLSQMNCCPRLWVLILGASLLALVGCGGGTSANSATDRSPQQVELSEVGEMYRIFLADNRRPAQAVKDLLKYAVAFDSGAMALQEKRVVVVWGTSLDPGSREVLAYQKGAPESGGLVLLRDGETVVPLAAEEVRAATKGHAKPTD